MEHLALCLKAEGFKPFLDKWHLVPGEPWQEAIEKALDRSRTCAVFVGPGHLGPWQNEEMRNALEIRVRDDSRRVIPVLLPGASMPELPPFLARLTWVDFRSGLDDPHALYRLLCGIRGVMPEKGLAGSEPLLPPSARPTMIRVPHRNPFFTGREALLSQLHQQLQTQGTSVLAQAAIHGLGGIGKTQTAIEYAHRYGGHYHFVLWVVVESEAALQAEYLSIARELGLIDTKADLEVAVRAVKAWLAREDLWLLVFDNADDPAMVRPYLPPRRNGGNVLLTSRSKSFVKVGIRDPLRVETLYPNEAVDFLMERTGKADAQGAAALAAELGYLPLALEQAAAYIHTMGASFAEYLTRYQSQGLALLERGKPSTDYSKTVATTWTLSFIAVHEASPASAELLTAAAFLVPDSVPIEIFTWGGSEFGKETQSRKVHWRLILELFSFYRHSQPFIGDALSKALITSRTNKLDFWELLEPLERYSLVERLPDDAFKLHRLTQEVMRISLGEKGRRVWAERVVGALSAVYPNVEVSTWHTCERLQPHAIQAADLTKRYMISEAAASRLLNQAGYFASTRGNLAGARKLQEQALKIQKRVLGGEHPDILMTMNNLADTLRALGDFAGARKLQEQTLKIQERVLGGEHSGTLMTMNNLAATLRNLGDLATARKL
ncbi:MAG TPA: FxSxx-COOH system tetratricopeptide repeat protein, partial [Thermoanaerobaculia bacterium]|nr:FxSxx-COOH system tetratricopeptide repeat protein [Thermoanaerobaculia bacterium]